MSKWFNQDMTMTEARQLLFDLGNKKSEKEIETIKKEFAEIAPLITARELKENEGWFADD